MVVTVDPAADLAAALPRAAAAHGRHEERIGPADQDRPDWYAQAVSPAQAGPGAGT